MKVQILTVGSQVRILSKGKRQYMVGSIRKLLTYADEKGVRRIAHLYLGGRGPKSRQCFTVSELEII
jgi:hypothetical protein